MTDLSAMKLGRAPVKYDPRTLRVEAYLPAKLPTPKPSIVRSNLISDWGVMLNDRIGDCTCAGWAHLKLLRSTMRGSPVRLSDDAVQSLYVAITGREGAAYDPATGSNDNGCAELDVLNYLENQGELGAFASLRPLGSDAVRFVIDAFEGIYVGCRLPLSVKVPQDVWDAGGPLTGDATPGSWGGHCMIAVDYDASGVTFITWGMTQKATWAWWNAYVDECYAILSSDLVTGAKPAPSGFNLAQLQVDLRAVSG